MSLFIKTDSSTPLQTFSKNSFNPKVAYPYKLRKKEKRKKVEESFRRKVTFKSPNKTTH